ncbi:hypothetical protein Rhow_008769 [Rhodococcus wratislaviensis]|uniref:Uncharacterized protein n=1 Tax=Rhodococcus wratislaviensis TaxID=44752 RepID=A0A402CLF8_RHOWR|nr:hypothetical protein [Rhodococcus wratislaviensis]GCE44348.1 hypothetical protein Rhow_008769 [Rhodococcus wratislaviensis]
MADQNRPDVPPVVVTLNPTNRPFANNLTRINRSDRRRNSNFRCHART